MRPYVEVHEDGTGPYLLLVHGFLSSRVQWTLNLDELKTFCRPVVVELWGHGRSPAPEDPAAYSVETYIRCFEGIRADLGVEAWYICGQSFGAGLTLNYALAHPDAIRAQIFTNSVSALAQRDEETEAAAAMRMLAEEILVEGISATHQLPFHPRRARRFPMHIFKAMNEDADRADPTAIVHSIRETMPHLSVHDRFTSIRVPTLLVNGRWESRFQLMRIEAEEIMPSIEIVDLNGGHSINIEAAALFNEAVRDFIAQFET